MDRFLELVYTSFYADTSQADDSMQAVCQILNIIQAIKTGWNCVDGIPLFTRIQSITILQNIQSDGPTVIHHTTMPLRPSQGQKGVLEQTKSRVHSGVVSQRTMFAISHVSCLFPKMTGTADSCVPWFYRLLGFDKTTLRVYVTISLSKASFIVYEFVLYLYVQTRAKPDIVLQIWLPNLTHRNVVAMR